MTFQQSLLCACPDQIRRIILYGSHARGDADPDSDADVMVVVDWEEERLPNGFYRSMYGDPDAEAFLAQAKEVVAEAVKTEGREDAGWSV